MKKTVFLNAKILVWVISIYGSMHSAYAQIEAATVSCPDPPSYIQIDYQFDWPPTEQKRLMDDFQLKCGFPRDVDWLVSRTASALKALGFSVTNSKLSLGSKYGQASLKLQTDKDDGYPRSALFPVQYFEFDDSILSYADITGVLREDETVVLRYALDDSRIRDPNSRVNVQWLRDGQLIKGEQKSRYKLTSVDVGSQLAAFVSVQDSDGVVYAQRTIKTKGKVGKVISPPEISSLEIRGDAVVGKIVAATYAYKDRNKSDKEQNSQFVWLRDGFVIREASGPSYQIVPQDSGKRISVRVTPRNIRGETGKTMSATMKQIVEDELITLRPEILADVGQKNRETEFFEPIQLKTKSFHELEGADFNPKNLVNKKLATTHNIYLTSELSIHHSSVRKIADLVYYPKSPFTEEFSENIKYQFFGEEISFRTARIILERLNKELHNANYEKIEAYYPKQIVKDGVLRIQFRKVQKDDYVSKNNYEKGFPSLRYLLIAAGLVCCI